MFFHDPGYMLIMLVGLALTFLPQIWVKSAYNRYSQVPASRGETGAQVAERILRENGVTNVIVEEVAGQLSDHYDPGAHAVRLSTDNYHGRSIAGVAIAAHEVGHALQHATGYYPVVLRAAMVPVVNLGSQLGPLLLMVSLGMGAVSHAMPGWAWGLAWLGVLLFSASVAFHIVTLPVEINASMRAIKILSDGRYVTTDELPGAKKVLTAAAFTYVAVALYSLIQLAYWVFRLVGSRRN
ncbi:MAG: zinc metallopeptidase [Vampirovibrionales bacterium]|nr:zinc metallopeptidase [Vampirovibrionales bacterium]